MQPLFVKETKFYAAPVREYIKHLDFKDSNHSVDFKMHWLKTLPLITFQNLERSGSKTLEFTLKKRKIVVESYSNMAELIAAYDVIVSPIGSLCLESVAAW